jgi:hypothetical protein
MKTLNRFSGHGYGWLKDLPDQRDHALDGIKCVVKPGNCWETEWPYTIAKFKTKSSAAGYPVALKSMVVSYHRMVQTLGQLKGYFRLPYADGCGAVWPVIFGGYPWQNDGYQPNEQIETETNQNQLKT